MCYSPTLIKNPNKGRTDKLAYLVDTVSQYIPVPCGHCGECTRLRSQSVLQRCQIEEQFGYPFFITLTYNNQSLPKIECSNGFEIAYTEISDLQNMFKRLRKSNALGRRFRYFAVSELGSKKGRPHAHALLFLEKLPQDTVYAPVNLEKTVFSAVLAEWRRNYARRVTKKGRIVADNVHPYWRPLLDYHRKYVFGKLCSTYDCHYVTPSPDSGSTESVSFYVSKYLVKDSVWREKLKRNIFGHCQSLEEAERIWSIVRPRAISSLNFGFGVYEDLNPKKVSHSQRLDILSSLPSSSIIRQAVERSADREPSPRFFDLQTGKSMPLARYYYKFGHLLSVESMDKFKSRQDRLDGGVSVDDRSVTSKFLSEQKFIKNSSDSLTSQLDLLYVQS